MIVEGYLHLMDAEDKVLARQQVTLEVTDEEIINVHAARITIPQHMVCTLPLKIAILLPVGEVPVGDPDKRELPDAGTDLLLGAGMIAKLSGP